MFKNNQELDYSDKPISFVKTRVVLCIWGKGHLPALSEFNVKALVSVINESMLFGTHGCTLTWGKQAWQLDSGLQAESGGPTERFGNPSTGKHDYATNRLRLGPRTILAWITSSQTIPDVAPLYYSTWPRNFLGPQSAVHY